MPCLPIEDERIFDEHERLCPLCSDPDDERAKMTPAIREYGSTKLMKQKEEDDRDDRRGD